MNEEGLRLDQVTVARGTFALQDVSFTVAKGEYLVMTGPNGAGKTTLLEGMAGLIPVIAGRIVLDGRDLTACPPEARGIGVVFQDGALFPHLTVAENVVFGLRVRRWTEARVLERLREVAAMTEIESLLARRPSTLSGGEQRRVAIARALAPSPHLLLLDEPLSGVDVSRTSALLELLSRLHRTFRLTVVHVAHRREEILAVAQRVAYVDVSRVIQVGSPEDFGAKWATRLPVEEEV